MSARIDPSGAAVRAHAARLNAEIVDGGRSLAAISLESEELSPRDLPLARSLLTESLRWHHRFERQLARLLDRPVKRRDRELAALLRIGLTQLAVLRIPDHAAVSATVAAASLLGIARAGGLVNAVLRRYLRGRAELDSALAEDEVARFSHPAWLIATIKHDWPEAFETILDANNAAPPFWLRVNRTRIERGAYMDLLARAAIDASIHPEFEDAVLLAVPRPVADLPGFDQGLVSVQDAAAQRAADLLELEPGQRVLDACAAPGGKTAHMLERCPRLAEVIAIDKDPSRLTLVRANLDRLGLGALLVAGSASAPGEWFDGRRFDRVLLDAPCSATGVIRRHPDIKVLRTADDPGRLADVQGKMLDALWPLVEPGGRLVYATCSVLAIENVEVVAAFVERTAGAEVAPFGASDHFQLLPGETNVDGFYYACLSKMG